MASESGGMDFVTLTGLISYAETFAQRARQYPSDDVIFPPPPPPSHDRAGLALRAMPEISAFAERAGQGFPDAAAYRVARRAVIDQKCGGDEVVFFAAWNKLVAEGRLTSLLLAPIGTIQKPARRRPVAIVPRAHLTPQLAEGRIVLDLGDERFWLLPRDLSDRTLLFTMRHGVSRVESKTRRVGCRLANVLDPERGISKADAVGAALARMLGMVHQQLDFLHVSNYLDPRTFLHFISRSPNTKQLSQRVRAALIPNAAVNVGPSCESALESSDFGWVTGVEKTVEAEEASRAFGVDVKLAKRLLKHPLYCYPGGNSFFDLYVDVIDGLHHLGQSHQGKVGCLYTHSSTMRALMIYLDPRPFHEAFTEFSDYKEGQDNVVLLTYEQGQLSGYSTAVGLSERERATREVWTSLERERKDRVTLKPRQLKRIIALVSGGDFAGAGAALKELFVSATRAGLAVHFVRHGFLGLANNWIETVAEQHTRGLVGQASSPIGSSRFEDFKDERIQHAAIKNLQPYLQDGALVVLGGDGSLRGARAIYENFGVQVVGIPGTIDDNIAGTTALGFHSAVALANQSIESLKATSGAMGSVFFVEVMGAGSGHLALACAYQARTEGILVNEHPDPNAYIDEIILGTLKRTLGVPNKSHLFVVAERTPHRHHRDGGVHGLVDYIARTIATWPQFQAGPGHYPLTIATKATILGHTLRGARPTPEDKAIAQDLAYEAVRRLIEQPEQIVGCMLAYREQRVIETIPLHAVAPKPFDWNVFARMHGSEPL
ncbi:MAG TPA: 6-phosphofructokinase [Nitrospiraceae bacterium]|nr:6-phosphofructokinase [Nitrospiraceae bacterium]